MNVNESQKLTMTTLNPDLSIRYVLINDVIALCGNSGDVIDSGKKWQTQGH